jgi:glycosyltransferase involved in cell wall biosynthesis
VRATLARIRRHRRIARARPSTDGVAVFYGHDRIPGPEDVAHGGMVKFQHLARRFPNEPSAFNVLYLGSSNRPADSSDLIRLARERGAAVAWNQDGVAYPGWHGPGWERTNEPLAEGLHAADHVFFQSEFCRLSSDRFLGERRGAAEVLPNPVDTERFTPAEARLARPLTLLLGGNQYQRYRLAAALDTLRLLPEARLLVAGRLSWDPDPRVVRRELPGLLAGLENRVELLGPYSQAEAPALYRRADLLLHTKYNDPCPTAVLEAMACGLPVVHSASGGTLELVGDVGIGVEAPLDWEHDHPPAAEELAAAVRECAGRLDELGAAARARALRFDVRPWLERHRAVFEELAG